MDHPENATVFILDDLGKRVGKASARVKAGRLEVRLPGDDHARFFEISMLLHQATISN